MDDKYARHYGSPFAIETTHIKLKDSDVHAEITRSLYNTAREYIESFDVYGSKAHLRVAAARGRGAGDPLPARTAKRVPVPDYAKLLPEPIQRFTTKGVYDLEGETHMSFIQGGGHGGSHPHLVNEFVSEHRRGSRPVPERRAVGELDLRGHLRARLGPARRRDRPAAGIHARVMTHQDWQSCDDCQSCSRFQLTYGGASWHDQSPSSPANGPT